MSQGKGSGPREGQYRRSQSNPFRKVKSPQDRYEENWERIFGKSEDKQPEADDRGK